MRCARCDAIRAHKSAVRRRATVPRGGGTRAGVPGRKGRIEAGSRPPGNGEEEGSYLQSVVDVVSSPTFYLTAGYLVGLKLVSMNEQVGTVLALSSVPFVSVYYIGNSNIGKKLEENLEERLPELQAKSEAAREAEAQAREESPYFGPNRPKWLGPLPFEYPEHLNGIQYAGDYGFDPLSLGREPEALDKYFEIELLHARWAMLGIVGCIVPEVLDMFGERLGLSFTEAVWWKVGAAKASGENLNYLGIEGIRIAGGQGIAVIALCQLVLMGGPEYARKVGIKGLEPLGIYLPGDINYPGGPLFDPLNLSRDAATFEKQKVREIKNGRLAMFAMLGLFVQAAVTREGAAQNFVDFWRDPLHNNILKYMP
eukprot:scaffold2636_cov340-Pavlova_lutheri.AAC.36